MKPQEKTTNFRIYPYSTFIINDTSLIYHEKIFYLYREKLLPNGILDMELLTDNDNPEDEEKKFVNGVFEIDGSNQFMCVFKYSQSGEIEKKLDSNEDVS